MQRPINLKRVMGGLVTLAALVLPASGADAQTQATCEFRTHITLTSPFALMARTAAARNVVPRKRPGAGRFDSDGPGAAQCTGWLGSQLVGGPGDFEISGGFLSGLIGGRMCLTSFSWASFRASAPHMLTLFHLRSVRMIGNVASQQLGPAMLLSGTGQAGADPVTYTGLGTFTPDSGQSCLTTGISSGTLTERVWIQQRSSTDSSPPASASGHYTQPPRRATRRPRHHAPRRHQPGRHHSTHRHSDFSGSSR
jgi:hypothetical protein